jgi:hypothetical protein
MRAGRAVRDTTSGLLLAVLLVSAAQAGPPGPDKAAPTLRWEEGQPGCTFSREDDGKYRYGFWTADFGIVLAVDSQELEKAQRRAHGTFAVLLTMHYRGKDSVDVAPGRITLEFVKHYHDAHPALDPDSLATKQQEAKVAARQKDAADMIAFLKTGSLRATTVDSGHPEASGWVLFSTKSKWIEGLQKQEEFVLRVPLGNRIVEFPFSLPPSEGDLILRHRPEN